MPTYRSSRPRVIITIGDPSGIGPEITLKALAGLSGTLNADFLIVGDISVINAVQKKIKIPVRSNLISDHNINIRKGSINILDLGYIKDTKIVFGKINPDYARAFIRYISKAVSLLKMNFGDALVTAPINKEAASGVGFGFPGHTEYLASLTDTKEFAMMMIAEPLRITLVTRHIPLADVAKSITENGIIQAVILTRDVLKSRFKIKSPAIAVCGLNPHAGESGVIGNEEKDIIRPAVSRLQKKFKGIRGPIPADAVFYSAYKGGYDAVICMYHDQGLIPLKMTSRDKGVNMTLGLPFIRTSPDHGTAYDIAGKGIADPSSMMEAIKLAVLLSKNTRAI